jgi:hypothetical protein
MCFVVHFFGEGFNERAADHNRGNHCEKSKWHEDGN